MIALEKKASKQLNISGELNQQMTQQAPRIVSIAQAWARAFQEGHKLMFCGNGGSAAEAQHFAAELVGRFSIERGPLAAMAMTTDTSILTAVSNDWSFDQIFSRQVAGLGQPGDIVVGISTSGNSRNVLLAMEEARIRGMLTVAFTGPNGALQGLVDYALCVPSSETPRIQEVHLTVGHVICELVESIMFGNSA